MILKKLVSMITEKWLFLENEVNAMPNIGLVLDVRSLSKEDKGKSKGSRDFCGRI